MYAFTWNTIQTALKTPVHRPLEGDGDFRLIQLVPDAANSSQGGFRVALQHFTLKDAPPFHVLSYTRGPSINRWITAEWDRVIGCSHFSDTDAPSNPNAQCKPRASRKPEVQSEPEVQSKLDAQTKTDAQTQPNGSSGESWAGSLAGSLANRIISAFPTKVVSKTDLVSIKVNGGQLKVHQSVVDFLQMAYQQQRYRPRDLMRIDPDSKADSKTEETYLWVDSICINLENAEERDRQVTQLGSIYKTGLKTIVWLSGNEPPEGVSRTLGEFLPKYLGERDEKVFAAFWCKLFEDDGAESSPRDEIIHRWAEEELLHFCTFVARHEFFYRHGWIQEVLLAQHVELACGRRSWDWMALERFIFASAPAARQVLNYHLTRSTKLWVTFHRMLDVIEGMEAYGWIRRLWVRGSAEARRWEVTRQFGPLRDSQEEIYCQIAYIMRMLRGAKFDDKEDAIYGWQALTKLALPEGKTYGSPSYTLSTHKVYVQFTRSLLKGMSILDVLNDVGETTWHGVWADIPSWVPDYSRRPIAVPLYRRVRDNKSVDFDATLTRTRAGKAKRVVEFEDNCLVLSGIRLDVIQERGPDFPNHIQISGETKIEWFLQKILELGETYGPTGQPTQEALCFTMVADSFVPDGPLTYAEAFRGMWGHLTLLRMHKLTEAGRLDLAQLKLKLFKSTTGESWLYPTKEDMARSRVEGPGLSARRRSTADMVYRLSKTLPGRAPYVTRKGYMGLGHRDLKAGEEIWLLEGGRTPFILWPGPTGYRLVGETYVHGFMRGEGWTPEQRDLEQVRIV
ncbi:heterokaryon incompatibility protein [Ilyonectria robusta]